MKRKKNHGREVRKERAYLSDMGDESWYKGYTHTVCVCMSVYIYIYLICTQNSVSGSFNIKIKRNEASLVPGDSIVFLNY